MCEVESCLSGMDCFVQLYYCLFVGMFASYFRVELFGVWVEKFVMDLDRCCVVHCYYWGDFFWQYFV